VLVNNTALQAALSYYASKGCNYLNSTVRQQFQALLSQAFVVLPWWSEYTGCPFCLFDFQMPRGSLNVGNGKAVEVLVLIYKNPTNTPQLGLNINTALSLFGISPPPNTNNYCPASANNPYAVYNLDGVEYFFNSSDLAQWSRGVSYSTRACHLAPGVQQAGPAPTPINYSTQVSVYGSKYGGFVLGAIYQAKSYDVGYLAWSNPISIQPSWPGYQVRTLVNVTQANSSEMGFLALYFGGYQNINPSSPTFPFCADMVAVQPHGYPQTLTWSYLPQGYGSGPWHEYNWQYGGSFVSLQRLRWYVLSISQLTSGSTYLAVYKFLSNSSGAMAPYTGQWLSMSYINNFAIVLGSDTEDAPASTTNSWIEEAVYAFLAIRPWTYPEPAVALTQLSGAPVLNPPRRVVLAYGNYSSVSARVSGIGNISLALVFGLNITQRLSVNASAVGARLKPYNATYGIYTLNVTVSANVPRSSLGASFTAIYNYGGVLYNYTCGVSNICNQTLLAYYGWDGRSDISLYNVSALVPLHSTPAFLANLMGITFAVDNLTAVHPNAYYNWSGNSLLLVNNGTMDAVFYFPWYGNSPTVSSVTPNDGVFGARLDITSPSGNYTLVMVPPYSAVNVTFYGQYVAQIKNNFPNKYAPAWERKYINPMPWPPATNTGTCKFVPVYFPSPYPGDRFVLMVPPSVLSALGLGAKDVGSIFIFNGSWQPQQPQNGLPYIVGSYGELWVNITASPGWFAYRGTLLALCKSSSSSGTGASGPSQSKGGKSSSGTGALGPSQIFLKYINSTLLQNSGGVINVGLSNYPYGFAVLVNITSSQTRGMIPTLPDYVWLGNSSSPSSGPSSCRWLGPGVIMYQSGTQPPWWNQYGGVCYNQYVWQNNGSGTPVYFIFGVTANFVNFHIATVNSNGVKSNGVLNDYTLWWFNGWPNTQYNSAVVTGGYNGPMRNFQYVYASGVNSYGVDILPYMWPLPYFIVNGRQYTTI
ncbi:MAG: hypothetical protein QXK63_03490, partial [Thermoproteus sp.]